MNLFKYIAIQIESFLPSSVASGKAALIMFKYQLHNKRTVEPMNNLKKNQKKEI